MRRWRLIVDEPADGTWNMAVDRAILAAHAAGEAAATLRLYRWSPPTVSLGRFQSASDVDLEYCTREGIGVCRRPTGGRGVLHDDELTYSIVAGVSDGIPRGVRHSYGLLCTALAEAYRSLGVDAALTSRERGQRASGACYLHATAADLSIGAAKLSGSAQVWDRDSCLQHGSFVVSRDVVREAAVFRLDSAGSHELAGTTATIEGVVGRRPAFADLGAAIAHAVEHSLDVRLDAGALSAAERSSAEDARDEFAVAADAGPGASASGT